MYSHRYSVIECPSCDHDLTAEDGAIIEIYREGVGPGFIPSRLLIDGFVVDVYGVIRDGLHGDTLCGGCGKPLNEYEVF